MPLPYRDIYDRWERSKSFGDPRDIAKFSADMNKVTGTRDFDAGVNAGWWTRTSHAADVNVFEPFAKATGLTELGGSIGGLFGDPYRETGERVAKSLPRMIAQTVPLIAAEVLSGGAATPIVAGALATGGLFGAQTYAETGSPTAAAISGVTAAALPAAGRIGGEIGVKTLGPEVQRVLTQQGMRTLPKEAGHALRYKAARFAGSQTGMLGTQLAGEALQSRELGIPFDPFSPEFIASQIPFSFLDVVQTARAKVPTAGQVKIKPTLPKTREYVPPKTEAVEEANLQDLLDRMTGIAKDQTVAPEEKTKAFGELFKTVMNPTTTAEPRQDRVILIGHPKVMENGSIKLFGTASKYYDLPEHKNVFINNSESATQMVNPDGSVTFIVPRKNVSSNVKYPAGPNDFPALRGKGTEPLTPAAAPTGEGIAPETDLLSLRQKFQQTVKNEAIFQAALGKEPKDLDAAVTYWNTAIEKMTPVHLRPGEQSPFDTGEQTVMREAGVEPTEAVVVPEKTIRGMAIQYPDGRTFEGPSHAQAYLAAKDAGYGEQKVASAGYVQADGTFVPQEEKVSLYRGATADEIIPTNFDDIKTAYDRMGEIEKEVLELTGDSFMLTSSKYARKAFGHEGYPDEIDAKLTPLFDEYRKHEDLVAGYEEFGEYQEAKTERPQRPFLNPEQRSKFNAAAVRAPDGTMFTGSFHGNAFARAMEAGYSEDQITSFEHGFLTKDGKFVGPSEAAEMVPDYPVSGELVSEDFGPGGVSPETEIKKTVQKIETSEAEAADAQQQIDLVPQTAEQVTDTLFHGTKLPVQKFVAGNPVYLTRDLTAAKGYALSPERIEGSARTPPIAGKPRLLKVKTQFEKVAEVEDVEKIIKDLKSRDSVTEILMGASVDSEKVFDKLVADGYDGINYFDQNPQTGDVVEATIALRPERLQVQATRAALKSITGDGATPTQAVETVRLQQLTPKVDTAKQKGNLAKDDLRDAVRRGKAPETRAGFLKDSKTNKAFTFVEPSAADTFLTRYKSENPDDPMNYRVTRVRGKYKIRVLPREVSYEGKPGTSLENVIAAPEAERTTKTVDVTDPEEMRDLLLEEAATTPVAEPLSGTEGIFIPDAETRPDVSFNDYLGQLDMASQNPTRLMHSAGFEDMPTTITATRQFRTALTEVFSQGKQGLKEVNAALKAKGILTFDSEAEMVDTFKQMRSGLEEFTGKYRSFALDSTTPHDPVLAQEIGILDPTRGATNFLDWYIKNQPSGLMRDLAEGLRKFADFSPITNEEGRGFWFDRVNRKTNLSYLPASREEALNEWGPTVMHELAHDSVRDLKVRTDPAATKFKADLQRILKTIRESKLIPQEVRKAINLATKEGWYGKSPEEYKANYDKALPGRETWKNVHYSLQNEYELIAGIFDSPELVRIMQQTKMPKSPVSILNFFAQAWSRMFGYTPNAENAFAQLLSSYDNYLSGTRNSKGYNGVSYIRDSLIASGTAPQAMSSRITTINDTYSQGDLAASIKGFEREMEQGLLPATTVAGKLNETVKAALVTGDPKAISEATANLLAEEVPQHQELWWRMKEDIKIAKALHDEAKKGSLFAETSLFQEGLKNQFAKLNAMKNELDRHNGAIARWNTMSALTNSDDMTKLWSNSLKGEKVPEPTEQTGNEDIARQALGLEPKGAEYITAERRRLAETGEKPLGLLERMFKFASFVSREQPAFRPIYQAMHETQANAFRRMEEMGVVKNSGSSKGLSKPVMKANKRVAETPGLNQIVSDMLRRANVLEKMRQPVSLTDDEMQTALRRASDAKRRDGRSDRDDVITAFNSEAARSQYRVDHVIPQHLDMTNRSLTALSIIGREIGMPSSKAIELSEQLHAALKQLRDPAQQVPGAEMLRQVASQMQPATFLKVMEQTNGFIEDSARHLKMLQSFRHYTGEQRYGNYHLVMSREGEPYREGFQTEKAARARAKELQEDGWILEDVVPVEKANVSGYLKAEDPLIASQRELDQQTLNRLESVISDLPLERQEMLRPLVQRAAEYEASAAAFSPVPTQASSRRKFRAGRETIDMIANAEEETKRFVNWMRHRESRILTATHMLDPEMLANRSLKDYSRQFIDNQLAADSPFARKFNEAAFYWYLAGNFGNDILESMQTLTTGMASMISETGSVRDAGKYIAGASGKVFKRYTTGKWGNKDTEWFINWLSSRGSLGLPTWGDVFDPTTQNYFDVRAPKSAPGKALHAVKQGLRGYKSLFLRHNDMVGGLAGFQLGRDLGMGLEDAARFAEGVKNRGLYSGGKVQRAVGMFSIKEKAVPQLMGSLKTYIQGFFSQLAHNYKVGFADAPGDFTPAQRLGAKKAFLYMLGAQATLAGALGLPGIGQAMALLKQTTGVDVKGWTRKNLASMFGEDQDDYGGFMTGLALHGLLSQAAPFDLSGRQIADVPFTGVSSWKGFDMSNIVPVPFSLATDFLKGLGGLAKGGDPSKAFPLALRGPVQLIHGGGDIRNSRGELLYNLSSTERLMKGLGLEPSRVAAAKETASTVKSMNDAAEARKLASIGAVADLYSRGDTVGAQRRLAQTLKDNPSYDSADFVRSVATAVEKRKFPYDWKREVNPAVDIAGLANNQPSRELERLQLRRAVASGLGLYEPPNLRSNIRAASVDALMNADPYTTRSSALQRLLTTRRLQRRSAFALPEGYQ